MDQTSFPVMAPNGPDPRWPESYVAVRVRRGKGEEHPLLRRLGKVFFRPVSGTHFVEVTTSLFRGEAARRADFPIHKTTPPGTWNLRMARPDSEAVRPPAAGIDAQRSTFKVASRCAFSAVRILAGC